MAVKISDLLPKKTSIDTGNGNLEVGAITLQGITTLIQNYRDPIMQLIATGSKGNPDFSVLVVSAPNMIRDMIAMGADAVGQEDDIEKLSFSVQAIAAAKIWEVSVPDVKKLISVLSTVLGQIKSQSPLVKAADQTALKKD